jgi:hypothetical protein
MNRFFRMLFALALLAGASLLVPPAEAAFYGYCDTACPTLDGRCNCPKWTDRPGAVVFCGSWNRVGACWYG